MAADTEFLALGFSYELKDDISEPLRDIGSVWDRTTKTFSVASVKAKHTMTGMLDSAKDVFRKSKDKWSEFLDNTKQKFAGWRDAISSHVSFVSGSIASLAAGLGFAVALRKAEDLEDQIAQIAIRSKDLELSQDAISELTEDFAVLSGEMRVGTDVLTDFARRFAELGGTKKEILGLTEVGVKFNKVLGMSAEESANFIEQQIKINRLTPKAVEALGSAMLAYSKNTRASVSDMRNFLETNKDFIKTFKKGETREAVQKQLLAVRGMLSELDISEGAFADVMSRVTDITDEAGHTLLSMFGPANAREAILAGKDIDKVFLSMTRNMAGYARTVSKDLIPEMERAYGVPAGLLSELRTATEEDFGRIAKAMSKAAGDTTALEDAWSVLRSTTKDLREQFQALFGNIMIIFVIPALKVLAKILGKVNDILTPFVEKIRQLPDVFKNVVSLLGVILGGAAGADFLTQFVSKIFGKGTGGTKLFKTFFGKFKGAFSLLGKMVPKLALRFLGVVGAVLLAWDLGKILNKILVRPLVKAFGGEEALAKWDKFFKKITEPVDKVFVFIKNTFKKLFEGFMIGFGPLKETFAEVWGGIKEGFLSLWAVAKEVFSAFAEVFDEITAAFGVSGASGVKFMDIVRDIGIVIGILTKKYIKYLVFQIKLMAGVFRVLAKVIKPIIKTVLIPFRISIVTTVEAFKALWKIGKAVISFFKGEMSLKDLFTTSGKAIIDSFKNIFGKVLSIFGISKDKLIDSAVGSFKSMFGKIISIFSFTKDKLSSTVKSTAMLIARIFIGPVNPLIAAWTKVQDFFAGIIGKLGLGKFKTEFQEAGGQVKKVIMILQDVAKKVFDFLGVDKMIKAVELMVQIATKGKDALFGPSHKGGLDDPNITERTRQNLAKKRSQEEQKDKVLIDTNKMMAKELKRQNDLLESILVESQRGNKDITRALKDKQVQNIIRNSPKAAAFTNLTDAAFQGG